MLQRGAREYLKQEIDNVAKAFEEIWKDVGEEELPPYQQMSSGS